MFDASRLINEILGADRQRGATSGSQQQARSGGGDFLQMGRDYLSRNAGGIGGGAVAGGLAGYMMGSKKGRKMAKKAATYGGLALVAGLAYKAYSDYQGKKAGLPVVDGKVGSIPATMHQSTDETKQLSHIPMVPAGSGFDVAEMTERAAGFGATLVSAMIAAAKSDGQIDAEEHRAIFAKIEELDLSSEEKVFLFDQLNKPLDIDSIVGQARSKEQAVEVYIASLMAIEPDTPAEQAYLSMLAARLNLEGELVSQIHQTVLAAADD